jgi:hypothetical protein
MQMLKSQVFDRVPHVTKRAFSLALCCLLPAFAAVDTQAQSLVLPHVSGVATAPACAASANGTGHMICVVADSNLNLTAVSLLTKAGGFAPALDPPNPLPLKVSGDLFPGACASTADGTGDVVCAYSRESSTGLGFFGIRFNLFHGTVGREQSLSPDGGVITSCVNGDERFTVTGPPAQEGPAGATICASKGHNGMLVTYAFNPATGYSKLLDLNGNYLPAPICTNANDGTNEVICSLAPGVFNAAAGFVGETLAGIAFDPRTGFSTKVQSLFSGTQFPPGSTPGCATADNSGQVICAIVGNSNTLMGYAFNPRTGYVSALRTLGTAVTGAPSCSGLADKSNQVICAINSSSGIVMSVKFDPRTGANSGLKSTGIRSSETGGSPIGLSCTFENINPNQVSCGGVTTTANELFGVIVDP